MKIATLGIITRNDHILLGRKQGKPEIGEGTLNGPGGKLELGETLVECLVRETEEELGVILDPTRLELCAVITFFVNGVADFEVYVYRANYFFGEPKETASMVPEWHVIDKIPFGRMLESDDKWLPQLVRGEKFYANVYYKERAKGFLKIEFSPFID